MAADNPSNIIDRLAQSLGVKIETRRKWRRRGKVPGRWHVPLLDQARREGVELDLDALSRFRPAGLRARKAQIAKGEGGDHRQAPAGDHAPGRPACTEVDAKGRIALPPQVLEALGVRPGERVVIELEGGELRIRSLGSVVTGVQAFVRGLVPDEVSLVDELIAERRGETRRA